MQSRLAGEAIERVGDRDARPQVEVAKLALDVIHRAIAGDIERVRRFNQIGRASCRERVLCVV